MKIAEVRIRPANEDFVKAYASICFDVSFWSMTSRVIKGPTGLFISFPNGMKSAGGQRDIAFSVNAEKHDRASDTGGVRESRWRKASPKRSIGF
jgi:DNA-binding cell septation regulator SpoVG